mgnify:CR=1 FL=1
MNALQYWLEKHLVPVAAKIGSQKHLVALRDSFVGMMPATMVGGDGNISIGSDWHSTGCSPTICATWRI